MFFYFSYFHTQTSPEKKQQYFWKNIQRQKLSKHFWAIYFNFFRADKHLSELTTQFFYFLTYLIVFRSFKNQSNQRLTSTFLPKSRTHNAAQLKLAGLGPIHTSSSQIIFSKLRYCFIVQIFNRIWNWLQFWEDALSPSKGFGSQKPRFHLYETHNINFLNTERKQRQQKRQKKNDNKYRLVCSSPLPAVSKQICYWLQKSQLHLGEQQTLRN